MIRLLLLCYQYDYEYDKGPFMIMEMKDTFMEEL